MKAQQLANAAGHLSPIESDLAECDNGDLCHSACNENFDLAPNRRVGDTSPIKERTIERWENEGGKVPQHAQMKVADRAADAQLTKGQR